MLTVTLVATLASAALWQQWRGVEIETAERARLQSSWILVGGLDWSRLILREDALSGGASDNLTEPWATPLAEARLSTFLSLDNSSSDDADEAFLSGQIEDAQSRLNVMNLVNGPAISQPALLAFGKLFKLTGVPPEQLTELAQNLLLATATPADLPAGAQAPLLPQTVEELTWLGLTPVSIQLLKPYITVLPAFTAVNLNTASAEVIYAVLPQLDLGGARHLVQQRQGTPFASLNDVTRLLGTAAGQPGDAVQYGVTTAYFEVHGRLRLDHSVVEEISLVKRNGPDVAAVARQRGVSESPASSNPP